MPEPEPGEEGPDFAEDVANGPSTGGARPNSEGGDTKSADAEGPVMDPACALGMPAPNGALNMPRLGIPDIPDMPCMPGIPALMSWPNMPAVPFCGAMTSGPGALDTVLPGKSPPTGGLTWSSALDMTALDMLLDALFDILPGMLLAMPLGMVPPTGGAFHIGVPPLVRPTMPGPVPAPVLMPLPAPGPLPGPATTRSPALATAARPKGAVIEEPEAEIFLWASAFTGTCTFSTKVLVCSRTLSASVCKRGAWGPTLGSSVSITLASSFFNDSKFSGPAPESFWSTLRITRVACC
mmetsp:Transcript_18468/g.40380  ORF Transcript_18468/g.40380 Transcript_18468/m.40380 type:complete len:295 (-) Transcript_18468:1567-2451(-)